MSEGLEDAIAARAARCGIVLSPASRDALVAHARAVIENNPHLHLTTIVEPSELVERHLGEAFEGAALVDEHARGLLVDLGSGNGYPGLPLAAARPGLRAVLVEASQKKARFLREVVERGPFTGVSILERQVQRAGDLDEASPVSVLTARALGSWEKILPRLAGALDDDARILLWAGETVDTVRRRPVWQRFALETRHPLPGRDRSWIWEFRRKP